MCSGWLCEGRQIEKARGRRVEKATGRLKRQEREAGGGPGGIEGGVGGGEEVGEVGGKGGGGGVCAACEGEVEAEGNSEGEFVSESGEVFPSRAAYLSGERAAYEVYLKGEQMPSFIFHAAGHCGKLASLRGVLLKKGIDVPEEFMALEGFSLPKGDRGALAAGSAAQGTGGGTGALTAIPIPKGDRSGLEASALSKRGERGEGWEKFNRQRQQAGTDNS